MLFSLGCEHIMQNKNSVVMFCKTKEDRLPNICWSENVICVHLGHHIKNQMYNENDVQTASHRLTCW